jgi:DegV family protein with EDD domain
MTDHKIALITDSTSDIPKQIVAQHDVIVVPQVLIWGTQEYRDHITITSEEFYRRLATDPVHPGTSQPTAKDFLDAIDLGRQAGASEAVIITLSNQLSGTNDSAVQAQKMTKDMPVHVYDSLAVSMALGFQVLAAARARAAGASAQEMIAVANRVRKHSHLYFSLDTLEYLHRGGRIGGATKLIGTALQLKPTMTVDFTTGRIEAGERTRTRSKALQRVYEVFFEKMNTGKPMHVCVLHGAAPEEAAELEARARSEFAPVELLITHVSPVIGVHTGPGAIGLIGYTE